MKKKVSIILSGILIFSLVGCGGYKTNIEEAPNQEAKKEDSKETIKAIAEVGKEFVVETERGDYKFIINSLEKTDYRSEFSNKDPKDVIKLNYTYENIDFKYNGKITMRLGPEVFKLLDDQGNILDIYKRSSNEAKFVDAGERYTIEQYYMLETDSKSIKLKFSRADKTDAEMIVEI